MKVFYLEQNDMTRRAVELAFQAKGAEVYTAKPGDDFEHILEDWGAELFLIDYDSVGGVLDKFTSTQIPVVVTCEGEQEIGGVQAVYSKPINPVELAAALL